MTADLKTLERRALELMKQADFGPESIRVNAEIVELSPRDDGAWTRLGRCYLEQRQFDEAVTALRAALALNPTKTIATNLLAEVRKRRALTPTAVERATTGFSIREFALIEALAGDELVAGAASQNGSAVRYAQRHERRRRASSTRAAALAKAARSSFTPTATIPVATTGHVNAFHHGGRWEPQFNLGWFTPPFTPSCLRIGIGFNLSQSGRDPTCRRGAGTDPPVLRAFSTNDREIVAARTGAVDGRQRRLHPVRQSSARARHAARSRRRVAPVLPGSGRPSVGSSSAVGSFSTSRTTRES